MREQDKQTTKIQRWVHFIYDDRESDMLNSDDGPWVTYDEHKAIVDSQTAQIAVQELAIAQARAEVQRLTDLLSEEQRMHSETIKQLESLCTKDKPVKSEWGSVVSIPDQGETK